MDAVAGAWSPARPSDAANLLAGISAPWWIAGGWALDLFRGTLTRPHADLDVGVLRHHVASVLNRLSAWEIFEAKDGHLSPLTAANELPVDVHSLWCRPTAADPWTIELMLDEADGDTWVYRRAPKIRRRISTIIRQNPEGVPYLAPEIQLLYKSKGTRSRDDVDFAGTYPLLGADARRWLYDALTLTTPDHRWIKILRDSEAGTTTPTLPNS